MLFKKIESLMRNRTSIFVFAFFFNILIFTLSFQALCNVDSLHPKAVFLELNIFKQEADGIFQAVRAQLSGSSLSLDRYSWDGELHDWKSKTQAAAEVSAAFSASMVFWIEDRESLKVFFFIPSKSGGIYFSRSLTIAQETGSGRSEVIGIAVAGMAEGILITHHQEIAAAATLPVKKADKEEPLKAEITEASSRSSYFELSLAYSGIHFSKSSFEHGAVCNFGLLMKRLLFDIRFRMTFPEKFNNQFIVLTLLSRTLGVSLSSRFIIQKVEIRIGAAYLVDLRSFSVLKNSIAVQSTHSGFHAIHAISPLIAVLWNLTPRLSLLAETGVEIATKENDYTIVKEEEETIIASPYSAKASIRLGIAFKI